MGLIWRRQASPHAVTSRSPITWGLTTKSRCNPTIKPCQQPHLASTRPGHGSVRAGFRPFGYPTGASQVGKYPTRDSAGKRENWRVSSGSDRVFLGKILYVQILTFQRIPSPSGKEVWKMAPYSIFGRSKFAHIITDSPPSLMEGLNLLI